MKVGEKQMSEAIVQVSILYLFFAIVVTTIFLLIHKRIRNRLITFLFIILLISPSFLYIPIEINTYKYGKEFKNIKIDTGFNSPVIYYKVFSISETESELFYVEGKNGKHDMGNFYYFTKINGKWEFNKWGRTMWTRTGGSASEFTLPPYF
jgi:hypothetical protein